jgi:hypothetical protein
MRELAETMRDSKTSQRSWQGLVVVCFAAMLGTACGGGLNQASHSTTTTTTTKDASLSLNQSSIDFGDVQMGTSKSSSLTLTNSSPSGGPSITFSKVSASGSGFSATTSTLPIVLDPGQATTIKIAFAPKAVGAVKGALAITVDGAADPASVPLTGTGLGSMDLAVSPTTLSFGTVTMGASLSKKGTLTAGTEAVIVKSAAWSGQGYSVSGISFPVTVPAGGSVSYSVTFSPEASGAAAGTVSFVSDAAHSPSVEKFSGTGAQTQSQPPSGVQHAVDLSWSASSSLIVGYYTYRGTQSGGPYTKLNPSPLTDTSYSDGTVQSGTTYYYVVTSVDSESTESSYSNQVTAAVPSP